MSDPERDLPAIGQTCPCHTKILYKEVHDGIDCVIVIVMAVHTGDNNFGTIYLMNSFAYDGAGDIKLRDAIEVLGVTSDPQAIRMGIGLFDSLMNELKEVAPPVSDRCNMEPIINGVPTSALYASA